MNWVSNGTGRQIMSGQLPGNTSGTVRVRVKDTDRTTGNGATDTVDVHRIEILSAGAAGHQTPVVTIMEPSNGHTVSVDTSITFDASATDNEDGNLSGSINWSSDIDGQFGNGATVSLSTLSVGSHIVTAAATDSADNTGSDQVTVTVTGASGGGISLSVVSAKNKGRHTPQLSWSGASGNFVDVYRDGGKIAVTDNDGSYTDNTGNKGGRSYTYKVCEAGTNTCSNEASAVY